MVNSGVPMGRGFHSTLLEVQLVRFVLQILLFFFFFWCKVGGFLSKNDLFHVHICFPPQILVFIYHNTDNQAVLAENQSIFVQNGISVSHGNCGIQYLLFQFSFPGQVLLQPAAPGLCVDRARVCACKARKVFNFQDFTNFLLKNTGYQTKWGGEGKAQKDNA